MARAVFVLLALLIQDPPSDAPELAAGFHERIRVDGEQWYRIEGEGFLRVTARFEHHEGDVDLELFSAQGRRLASSLRHGDVESVAGLADGFAHLRVMVHDGGGATMSLEAVFPALPDLADRQDVTVEAETHFRVAGPGRVRITATVPEGGANVHLELLAWDGDRIERSRSGGDALDAHVPSEGALLRVYLPRGGTQETTLATERLGLPEVAGEPLEGGDELDDAVTVEPGDYAVLVENQAWFRIEGDGLLRIDAAFDARNGDIDAQILDAEGRAMASSAAIGDREVYTVPVQGHVHVRLYVSGRGANRCSFRVRRPEAPLLGVGEREVTVDGDCLFRLEGQGRVTIRLTFRRRDGDIDMRVTTAEGVELATGLSPGNGETLTVDLPDEPCLLRVWSTSYGVQRATVSVVRN